MKLSRAATASGSTVSALANGYQAYDAYQNGNGFTFVTGSGAAVGNVTHLYGVIANSATKSTLGGNIATATNLTADARISWQGLLGSGSELYDTFVTTPQRYSDNLKDMLNRNAAIAAREQAIYQQLQSQQPQATTPPTIVNVPQQ